MRNMSFAKLFSYMHKLEEMYKVLVLNLTKLRLPLRMELSSNEEDDEL